MKKNVLIIILLLISCTPLIGCNKDKKTDEKNTINLSIDKNIYDKEERIEVSIDPNKLNKNDAIMVIVKSNIKHDSEAAVHDDNYNYTYLADFDEIPMYIFSPNEEGQFDVRIYENNDGGKELASVTFEVKEGGSTESSRKSDDKQDDNNEKCRQINEEHMSHFQIVGFDVDSSYCVYEYDYRDYIDTIKIFYVANEAEQIRAAQYIFDKSRSYESLDDGRNISSIEDAKYFVDGSYKFLNDKYTYTIKLQKEAEEENPFNDLSVKANSIIIEITPRGR